MPYRRLPNTDSARVRALKRAVEISKDIPPFRLAFFNEDTGKDPCFSSVI